MKNILILLFIFMYVSIACSHSQDSKDIDKYVGNAFYRTDYKGYYCYFTKSEDGSIFANYLDSNRLQDGCLVFKFISTKDGEYYFYRYINNVLIYHLITFDTNNSMILSGLRINTNDLNKDINSMTNNYFGFTLKFADNSSEEYSIILDTFNKASNENLIKFDDNYDIAKDKNQQFYIEVINTVLQSKQ